MDEDIQAWIDVADIVGGESDLPLAAGSDIFPSQGGTWVLSRDGEADLTRAGWIERINWRSESSISLVSMLGWILIEEAHVSLREESNTFAMSDYDVREGCPKAQAALSKDPWSRNRGSLAESFPHISPTKVFSAGPDTVLTNDEPGTFRGRQITGKQSKSSSHLYWSICAILGLALLACRL